MYSRRFGIEFEFSLRRACDVDDLIDRLRRKQPRDFSWYGDYDGSGLEICTPPMRWAQWPLVSLALQQLRRWGGRCTRDDGLHIHHDAARMTNEELTNLVYFWCRHERHMYRLVAPWRRRSWACEPLYRKLNYAAIAHDRDYEERCGESLLRDVTYFDRYVGLNITEAYDAGYDDARTVEFRLHEGTLDTLEVRQWVRLTQRFVEQGIKYTGAGRYSTPREFVREVGAAYLGRRMLSKIAHN